MKKLHTLLLAAVLFAGCRKTDIDRVIVEPPFQKQISRDTITSGQHLGFTIGQTSADVYAKLQQVQVAEKIGGLTIVKNIYTDIDSLKTRLPLYTGIFMDEQKGTSTGVQISFENDKVKAMYINDGTRITRWPYDTGRDATISIGDPVNSIYQKLVNIKKKSALAKKLEHLSVIFKDINKPYDRQMGVSPQWYFGSILSSNTYRHVSLNFTAGKLVSIYSAVFESQ